MHFSSIILSLNRLAMIKKIAFLLLLLLVCAMNVHSGQKRIALVVGNSDYKNSPLKNPLNDARDMAAHLQSLGFSVTKLINADKRAMDQAIRMFAKKLNQQGSIGLFYFAGHGLQVNNQNYLVPIAAQIENESDVPYETIDVGRILAKMDYAQNSLNLVVLDACRNNPYSRSFRSVNRGLALIRPAIGTLILYATEPGNVAADGKGKNGLFTEKLMAAMTEPGVKVQDVFQNTANAVNSASQGKQTPWSEGTIIGANFYFKEIYASVQAKPKPSVAQTADNVDSSENIFWRSIDKKPSVEGYSTYLQQYPQGHYAPIARYKIKQLNAHSLSRKSPTVAQQGKLIVRSNVYGDSVFINGVNKGSSRLELQLKPGRYVLKVTRSGYDDWQKNIQIKAGTEQQIFSKLKKKPVKTVKKALSVERLSQDDHVPEVALKHLFKVRYILLKTEYEAFKIYHRLKNNNSLAHFVTLARQYSVDKATAVKGGDLGWVNADTMVKPFAQAIKKANIAQAISPVHSVYGWSIIWVEDSQ